MTWKKRIGAGAAGAILLGVAGMLAAEASCSNNHTGLPSGAIATSVCAMERWDHGDPYTGRTIEPVRASVSEQDDNAGYSQTDVNVYQNRFIFPASGQEWRDTRVNVARFHHLRPAGQDLYAQVYFEQTDYRDPVTAYRYSYGTATVQTNGALGSAYVFGSATQYRHDGPCTQSGQIYAQASSAATSTPIAPHECAVELPLIPEAP